MLHEFQIYRLGLQRKGRNDGSWRYERGLEPKELLVAPGFNWPIRGVLTEDIEIFAPLTSQGVLKASHTDLPAGMTTRTSSSPALRCT